MPKWSPPINHLPYGDDIMLFCSGENQSIKKMMNVLRGYEQVSIQLINLSKSLFYLHERIPMIYKIRIRRLTGIRQGEFPFTYLGCPVYYGRAKCYYFEESLRKISRRTFLWQNRLLSFDGKIILVRHVLQSMPLHLLSALCPPKGCNQSHAQYLCQIFLVQLLNREKKTLVCLGWLVHTNRRRRLGF